MTNVRMQYFIDELHSHKEFQQANIYSKNNSIWETASDNVKIIDNYLEKNLNSTPSDNYLKDIKNNIAYYWVENYTIAIALPTPKRTQTKTLASKQDSISKCYDNANRSFNANHDPLTGLLNRNGAKLKFDRYLSNYPQKIKNSTSSTETGSPYQGEIGLISFDIDHFKQVNDTYSHDHGDAILKIFANRLITLTNEIEKKLRYKFILSRPGGEEFELIVMGDINNKNINSVAEEYRSSILNPSLPTEKEWNISCTEIGLKDNTFSGAITSSIGTSVVKLEDNISFSEKYAQLRQQADAALSRAKNDNRNCIRYYGDIHTKHGKIINHHTDSELIIIDIGSTVGVKVGTSYEVFFPPYNSNTPIIKSDGRSEKKYWILL